MAGNFCWFKYCLQNSNVCKVLPQNLKKSIQGLVNVPELFAIYEKYEADCNGVTHWHFFVS